MPEVVQITSKDNRRLVELRKLRDGVANDRLFLEGRRLVEEALRSDVEIEEAYFSDSFADSDLTRAVLQRANFAAELPDRIFQFVADTKSPQGILVTASRPASTLKDLDRRISSGALPVVVMLADVNNPANLGAIARTAEAADAAGLIVARGSADAFSPKSLRAAMGSNLRVPIVVGLEANAIAAWAALNDFTIVTTEVRSGTNYIDRDWSRKSLLVFGSEAHGVGDEIKQHAGDSVRIPMCNEVESLNLGVSAGIILFEARRQNA